MIKFNESTRNNFLENTIFDKNTYGDIEYLGLLIEQIKEIEGSSAFILDTSTVKTTNELFGLSEVGRIFEVFEPEEKKDETDEITGTTKLITTKIDEEFTPYIQFKERSKIIVEGYTDENTIIPILKDRLNTLQIDTEKNKFY